MKTFPITIMLFVINFSTFSQSTDTCDWVSSTNYYQGLDCYLESGAPYIADSYQWLNCDSSYAVIPGDTNSWFSGGVSNSYNVALVITYLGCVDTGYCQSCTIGLIELIPKDKKLLKVVDLMGRESEDKPNTPLIYIYNDGTREKIYRME